VALVGTTVVVDGVKVVVAGAAVVAGGAVVAGTVVVGEAGDGEADGG
jgi:uncharacterized Zn-binding protein involved in type VI secretion